MADLKMKHTDVVIIGFGWTGAILAKEMTEAGLRVVALERGADRDTATDGPYPGSIDELTYQTRGKLYQNLSKSTVTIRHSINDVAVPNRQLKVFLPGDGVGGAGLHWSGMHFRVAPAELKLRSTVEQRYGKKFIPEGMNLQDWGVSYEELEPHFDFAEKVFGTSGQAYKVGDKVVGPGNPFAPSRSNPFPLPALKDVYSGEVFRKAATELGFHPYSIPAANATQPYTNPYGCQMGPCNFCGYCTGYACYMYSKASPNLNILPVLRTEALFELRTNSNVMRINLDGSKKKATGVTYMNAAGQLVEQSADLVLLCSFAYNNPRLLLLSGIGKPYDPVSNTGVVGRNFVYQNQSKIRLFYDSDKHTNPFIGAGAAGVAMDDFNADNFDHGPHHFIGGAALWMNQAGLKSIAGITVPQGTKAWGSAWKQAARDAYTYSIALEPCGSNMAYRDCYLDLDPTYKDAYGQPLLRMTFDWKDNDIRMLKWATDESLKIARAMNPKRIDVEVREQGAHFDTRLYQTTHLAGGAVMGDDPKTSVLNRYLQVWDVPNVFVYGASAFAHGIAYNPTGIVAALAYWSAKAIREQYLKDPRALVAA